MTSAYDDLSTYVQARFMNISPCRIRISLHIIFVILLVYCYKAGYTSMTINSGWLYKSIS